MSDAAQQSSLASEAYSVVRQRILTGTIGLGQVISRRKLAAELRMSFLPVSEALLRLEVEGLLESRPRAGTRVRIPSAEDVQGHYVVREALEVQAALRFAAFATPRERFELKKLANRVDLTLDTTDQSRRATRHLLERGGGGSQRLMRTHNVRRCGGDTGYEVIESLHC